MQHWSNENLNLSMCRCLAFDICLKRVSFKKGAIVKCYKLYSFVTCVSLRLVEFGTL